MVIWPGLGVKSVQIKSPYVRAGPVCRARSSGRAARRSAPRTNQGFHLVSFPTISPPLARALAERNYDQPTPVQTRRARGRSRRPRPAGFGPDRLGQDRRLRAGHGQGSARRRRAVRAGGRTACPDRRADPRARLAGPSRARMALCNMPTRASSPASAAWIRAASSASSRPALTSSSARPAGCAIICAAAVSISRN